MDMVWHAPNRVGKRPLVFCNYSKSLLQHRHTLGREPMFSMGWMRLRQFQQPRFGLRRPVDAAQAPPLRGTRLSDQTAGMSLAHPMHLQ